MKNKKAAGVDELPMEVWKYAGKDLWNGLVKLMKQIWRENVLPEVLEEKYYYADLQERRPE